MSNKSNSIYLLTLTEKGKATSRFNPCKNFNGDILFVTERFNMIGNILYKDKELTWEYVAITTKEYNEKTKKKDIVITLGGVYNIDARAPEKLDYMISKLGKTAVYRLAVSQYNANINNPARALMITRRAGKDGVKVQANLDNLKEIL